MTDTNFETNANPDFYVTGGTMSRTAPSYVARQADIDLLEGLKAGKFCYVLTSRQMGKSSLMVRTIERLKEADFAVIKIDLTEIGQNLTAEQWYDGLQFLIGQQLRLTEDLDKFWLDNSRLGPLQRLIKAMREIVLEKCKKNIVIFIDEVDVVHSLDFSTSEFFAGIRAFYNQRVEDTELNRLNFCLIGVTTTSDLIKNRTTPLNVGGERIELLDFSEKDAIPFASNLGTDKETNRKLLKRILYWTGGHPYLTQRFCKEVAEIQNLKTESEIDDLCESLFLSHSARESEENFVSVRDRMLHKDNDKMGLLVLYKKILNGKKVPNNNLNPFTKTLRLSGIVYPLNNGNLVVRNRIYERVFDENWAEANMPDAELREQKAVYRKRFIGLSAVTALMLFLAIFSGVQWVSANNALHQLGVTKTSLQETETRLNNREFELNETKKTLDNRESELNNTKQNLDKRDQLIDKQNLDIKQKEIQIAEKTKFAEIKSKEAIEQKARALEQQKIAEANFLKVQEKEAQAIEQKKIADQKTSEANLLNYSVSTRLAYDLYRNYDVQNFRQTLENTPVEYRGLEWDYLNQLNKGLVQFSNLPKGDSKERNDWEGRQISDITFTHDGRYLLTHLNNNTLLKWDLSTGQSEYIGEGPEGDEVVDFKISRDKNWLVYCNYTESSKLILWDISSPLWKKYIIPTDSQDRINFVSFTQNSKQIITISYDLNRITLQQWDIETKTKSGLSKTKMFGDSLRILKVSPIGQMLIEYHKSIESKRQISLLNSNLDEVQVLEKDYTPQILFKGEDSPLDYTFSPNGKRIAIFGFNNNPQFTTSIFDTAEKKLSKLPEDLVTSGNLRGQRQAMAFSENGDLLALSYSNGIKIISLETKKIVNEIAMEFGDFDRMPFLFDVLSISSDGLFLAVNSPKIDELSGSSFFDSVRYVLRHELKVFNLNSNENAFTFEDNTPVQVCCDSAVSKDGKLITQDNSGVWTLWDAFKKKKITTIPLSAIDSNQQRIANFSPNGKYFYTLVEEPNRKIDGNLSQLFDASTGAEIKLKSEPDCKFVSNPVFSSDGTKLAAVCQGGYIAAWSLVSFEKLKEFKIGLDGLSFSLYLKKDDKTIEVWKEQGVFLPYDFETGTQLRNYDSEASYIKSPDSKWLASGSPSEGYILQNISDNINEPVVLLYPRTFDSAYVKFSENSKFLIVYSQGRGRGIPSVYIKDLTTMKNIPIESGNLGVYMFSPSGLWVLQSLTAKINYWDTKKGKRMTLFQCSDNPLFSSSKNRLITSCSDGTVKFIDLLSGQELLRIKHHQSKIKKMILSKDEEYLLTVSETDVKLSRIKF